MECAFLTRGNVIEQVTVMIPQTNRIAVSLRTLWLVYTIKYSVITVGILHRYFEGFEGTDSFPQTFLTNPSKLGVYLQNSYCDHRNFDNVNQPLETQSSLF